MSKHKSEQDIQDKRDGKTGSVLKFKTGESMRLQVMILSRVLEEKRQNFGHFREVEADVLGGRGRGGWM